MPLPNTPHSEEKQPVTKRGLAFQCAELLKDISNAADNGQPYSARELDSMIAPILDSFRSIYGALPGEDYRATSPNQEKEKGSLTAKAEAGTSGEEGV